MKLRGGTVRFGIAAAAVGAMLALAPAASAATKVRWMEGFDAPGTPAELDRVGVLEQGPKRAKRILILNPGTSASAAYFRPLAATIARENGWQVWSVERRENLLEDQSVFNRVKRGKASGEEMFDYYLGFITDSDIEPHFEFIPDSEVAFARDWGMEVAVEDLRKVVSKANRSAKRVVLGGHSLGGTITTAYATWDFDGEPGASDLDGLVYIDGGSGPTPDSATEIVDELTALEGGSPWLTFGGISAPFTGLFNTVGSTLAHIAPDEASTLQEWPFLPANLRPPVEATNEASYGYALDADTSPPGLAAAQVNAGRLADRGYPRGWDRDGEITPISRVARMFSGTGIQDADGTSWYHPQRITIDAGAVADGNANPAQELTGVRATHGAELGTMPIYSFAASLGGERVLDAASALAEQSGIPSRKVKLVDRSSTYTHVDPLSASPRNAFVSNLTRFLAKQVG